MGHLGVHIAVGALRTVPRLGDGGFDHRAHRVRLSVGTDEYVRAMTLRTEPATAARFADVEAILAPKKAGAQGCWCLSYRLAPADNDALRQPHRGEELLRLCRRRSHVPGVLAYDGDEVVGWAAVAPRSELNGLADSHFPRDPDDP